jgi:hypothetical protein
MVRCLAHDLSTVSKRTKTDQGYLVGPAVIGRCGIQPYTRGELGLDGDPNAVVRLMRTPEEVFRPATIKSFENVPITNDHPPKGVDAGSWSEFSIGNARDIARVEGNLLGATTWVMDEGGVKEVEGGKEKLSCGYTFDLDLTPGVDPDGQPFDGYQRNILGDHLAIVDSPRGGPVCRIGDKDKKKETPMATKKVIVDGLPLELDEVQAAVVEKLVKDRDTVVADLAAHRTASTKAFKAKDSLHAEVVATKDKAIAAKDTEIGTLKADLVKAKAIDVDALVAERTQVITDAKKLAPKLEVKGTSHDIRKAALTACCSDGLSKTVVEKMLGADGIEKSTESQIKGAFEVLLALPQQAAIAAQDAALTRALTGTDTSFAGGGEVFGMDEPAESNAAA